MPRPLRLFLASFVFTAWHFVALLAARCSAVFAAHFSPDAFGHLLAFSWPRLYQSAAVGRLPVLGLLNWFCVGHCPASLPACLPSLWRINCNWQFHLAVALFYITFAAFRKANKPTFLCYSKSYSVFRLVMQLSLQDGLRH